MLDNLEADLLLQHPEACALIDKSVEADLLQIFEEAWNQTQAKSSYTAGTVNELSQVQLQSTASVSEFKERPEGSSSPEEDGCTNC